MATTTKPIILDDTGSRIALAIEHLGDISEATYTFTGGVNGFTATPSGGRPAQTVTVTPSIADATQQASGLMSANDKVKLDGIEANAEVNVQADWNEASADSDAYIKNKPTIPTNVSQLTNDSNFMTNSQVSTAITTNNTDYVDVELAKKQDKLTAGTGISIAKDAEDNLVISNTVSSLAWGNIDGTLANQTDLQNALNAKQDVISDLADVKAGAAKGATSIQPQDNISVLYNDAGYVTAAYHDATKQDVISATDKLSVDLIDGLSAVATSGSYNSLSDKPTIPTVNDATLTIKKNGTTVNSFSANASENVDVNIVVPTAVSDLTNDAGYQNSTQVATAISTHNSANDAHADIRQAISNEASTRGTAVNGLQSQIDALTVASDVTDIVGTKAALDAYDTSKLHTNEIIKVLQDESRNNAVTYYRWVIPAGGTGSFTLIGEEGPFYTKGQVDAAFVPQTRTINGKALSGNVTLTAADVGATDNVGTITGITMNGASKGTSGVVDLGTVITAHQDISGKLSGSYGSDTTKFLRNDGSWAIPVTVDSAMSSTSTNPVQNKVINSALSGKANTADLATVATTGSYNNLSDKPTIPAAVAVKGDSETTYRTGNVNITKANIGLGNVGNYKAVSTVASQGLTDTEKANARANIGAGTSSFSGSYNDLSNKPTIPVVDSTITGSGTSNPPSSAAVVSYIQSLNGDNIQY